MKSLVIRFWQDEIGSLLSAELIFMMTLICIGLIAGLATFRDQVVTEFADLADAVSEFDHSYVVPPLTVDGVGTVAGSSFTDTPDVCDAAGDVADQNGEAGTQCVVIGNVVVTNE